MAIVIGMFSYSFYLRPHLALVKKEIPGNNPLSPDGFNLDYGMLPDTFHADFHYLWTNFPEVILDSREDTRVLKYLSQAGWHGYSFGKVDFIVERDTLFIRHNNALMMPAPSDDTTSVLVVVHVPAKKLRGVEIVGKGRVGNASIRNDHRVFPFHPDQPETWQNFPVPIVNNIDLLFRNGGAADLYLKNSYLDVDIVGAAFQNHFTEIALRGNCSELRIDHRNAHLKFDAYQLRADTVTVNSDDRMDGADANFRVNANNYLEAELNGWANVLFQGAPRIKKSERYGGRVINANRYW
ncbi:hypothetical protein CRP01_09370 [Flavilitoribacter nigricans DSM 23189 = NBRC 102662]|uniref:Putative auto-transporter adhesin head GIN domain-containing protein n=2 Tax=Flavilitoribacter TaxID=2762562 RepID=A0A2D0NDF8_FLAN2|nr:hypothetical protein CRP01_09370 [Flavilitoribacter nigricans DSM 23189 = NBRC 102662]